MDSNRPTAPQLVFIGSPTQDVVLRDGTAHQVIGGAAYISALAARWANALVGIVARVPSQLPAMATGVFGPGGLFREGLSPHEGSLPAFRISYNAEDQASYSGIAPGLEQGLCSADIPSHWLGDTTRWIHIASIGFSTKKQLSMLKCIRDQSIQIDKIFRSMFHFGLPDVLLCTNIKSRQNVAEQHFMNC